MMSFLFLLQLELLKPEPIQIKGMDYADFWKSELAKCVREINLAYDEKIDLIQQDCEAKYAAQVSILVTWVLILAVFLVLIIII